MTSNRCRNATANSIEVQRLLLALKISEQFAEHLFHIAAFYACRYSLYDDSTRSKQLHLKAITPELIGDLGEDSLLPRSELYDDRHQHLLHWDGFGVPLFQHALEEHAFMSYMLIDDPEPLLIDRENERLTYLPQRS